MGWFDTYSNYRCHDCGMEIRYNTSHPVLYKAKETPGEEYTLETCPCCGEEYYVNISEPNHMVFGITLGKCKNDYIKNLVMRKKDLSIIDRNVCM